ncbi:carbohydrate kinase, YjeF related protein [Halothece sp. PCC 7418]|uniref:bifunctional ADP-dependent NAD(P)H-hydrate dehydratase/NAD(P)H-hydrate epimerase n=1 Tax=Halothece sp. (strain PCC 7418) TaxID=65093 RepID=UPI0002A05C86|nr:bifunctional ADP-dependent NAD(P)H-hydrate dehydratase/NAD(P)H-hydrate epimerase [Halothece sp. PCC 7418]AFZ44161.1 carbohydrate kinase, YjeF related protein [Halothece sp. PCC 7418]
MSHQISTDPIEHFVVTATQMAAIEQRIFAAGMPVAALMEKAAGLVTQRVIELYPPSEITKVGILVGPGHNGGDATVVGRELHCQGYQVCLYRPLQKAKELTQAHLNYVQSLGIPMVEDVKGLANCDLIVDGLFGFGMTRPLEGNLADAVETINQWSIPVVSIDIPSGLHTDTGEVLGTAIEANYSFCLGLWKRAFFQDSALAYLGKTERIDFGVSLADVQAVVSEDAVVKQMTVDFARSLLPLPRPLVTHKYKQGHLLIIAGSRQYAGGVILTGLGARASGVGMVSIAAPASLKPMLVTHLPEALIIDCPETENGAIAELPEIARQWNKYSAIALGPGLTLEAKALIPPILEATSPLILDADGLNALAQLDLKTALKPRSETTILTPHPGEFRRLFPDLTANSYHPIETVPTAAQETSAVILLKGARTVIASPDETWVIPESTPALARGGSGDVLTGLLGGLIAQNPNQQPISPAQLTTTAAVWHAQAGIKASLDHSDLGVDAFTLTQYLTQFPASSDQ